MPDLLRRCFHMIVQQQQKLILLQMAYHLLPFQVLLDMRPQMVQQAVFHFLTQFPGNLIIIPDPQKYFCILSVLPGQGLFQFCGKAFRCLRSCNNRFRLLCILFLLPNNSCSFFTVQIAFHHSRHSRQNFAFRFCPLTSFIIFLQFLPKAGLPVCFFPV